MTIPTGAEADIERFVERRAAKVKEDRPGQRAANELARMWAESDRRFEVRRRLQLAAERYRYHDHLAGVFGRMAEEHAARAAELLEGNEPKGGAA